nr:hypothetical protein [Tanacetum cinerariifolium]
MANLTFVDTHNMVAFLSKFDASACFDKIVDFLNAQVIQYALMVNPTIYVSCIKQFCATTSIKKANDVVKLRALIDGKQVVVYKDVIRQDLRLDDADGVECLPNEEIFTELARMGYEKLPPKLTFYKAFLFAQWKFLIHTLVQCVSVKWTAWNEFSCSMASSVICLATGRKFNFSKYIFDIMVRNVDSPSKFLSKGFSGVETPLFASMLVQPQAEVEEDDVEVPAAPTPPSSPPHEQQTDTFESLMSILNTLMETCATLSQKVAQLEQDKIAQALDILKLKKRVKKLEKKRRSKSYGLKRFRKVAISQRIESSTKTVMGAQEDASKQRGRIEAIDGDEDITLVDAETQVDENIDWNDVAEQMKKKHLDNIRKYQSLKRKPISIAQARINMIVYLKNMARYKMKHFRVMTYDKVRPIFEREYNKVQTLFKPDKVKEPTKKRVAEETLLEESFKKLKAVERLVKEKFSSMVPNVDKEKALWVELKRLFKPDADDVICKLQRYMHYPIAWKLHSNCGVHQVSSTTRRHDMYMLTEKDYPLSNGVMTLMRGTKLQVKEDSEMERDLVMKIFMKANQPKSKSKDDSAAEETKEITLSS